MVKRWADTHFSFEVGSGNKSRLELHVLFASNFFIKKVACASTMLQIERQSNIQCWHTYTCMYIHVCIFALGYNTEITEYFKIAKQ